ncbi:hypothetical protein ACFX5K_00585 [Rickettsiales bacterium LUAb2]
MYDNDDIDKIYSMNETNLSMFGKSLTKEDVVKYRINIKIKTSPLNFVNDREMVYRIDQRSPEIIIDKNIGFKGTNRAWWNKLFGDKTVYGSSDIAGINYFLHENKYIDSLQASSNNIYYLYAIDTNNIRLLDVAKEADNNPEFDLQLLKYYKENIYQPSFATEELQDMFLANMYKRIQAYTKNLSPFNKEVILEGPVDADRISFIKQVYFS